MNTLVLTDKANPPSNLPSFLLASWDGLGTGQISIPLELGYRNTQLRQELAAFTYELGCVRIWGKLMEEYLRAKDSLSMWWCSTLVEKHPKVTHNLFLALKLRTLELVIEDHNIQRILLFRSSHGDELLEPALQEFCQKTGRSLQCFTETDPTEPVTPPSQAWWKRLYYASPAPLKACSRFLVWLHKAWIPGKDLKLFLNEGEQQAASIVTYFPNIDMLAAAEGKFRSKYWENLHDLLDASVKKINWIFIYFPAPQLSFKEALKLRKKFQENYINKASFYFIEEFISGKDIIKSLRRYLRLVFASLQIEPEVRTKFYFAGSHMNLWPILKQNWADSTRGWRALERILMREAVRRLALAAKPQAFIMYPQENCPWERMLAQAMHETHVGPVYGMQHSTVRPTDFRYFDDVRMINDPTCHKAMPDLWLCNGSQAYAGLTNFGLPKERTQIVEALRYQYLSKLQQQAQASPAPKPTTLLVVTSFFSDETKAHMELFVKAWQAGLLEQWEVKLKAHPYLPLEPYLEPLQAHKDKLPIVQGPIGDYLVPGTLVWASNSTTVALEAVFCGLPVIVQMATNDLNLSPVQDLPGIANIATLEDLQTALANPSVAQLPADYLALDTPNLETQTSAASATPPPNLPRWRALLGE